MGNWQHMAEKRQKVYKKWLERSSLKKHLSSLRPLHEEAFSRISCLDCAQCCKNYSPRFKSPDIKRISKHLKMSERLFMDNFLQRDEDGDFVLKVKPCPFLQQDNRCRIYEVRPSDCARFPYTDEDTLLKKKGITLKNITFCPAVYYVIEKLICDTID